MANGQSNHLWDQYNIIIKLYIHHTSKYWKIYSIFLVVMGLLFAGFAQVIKINIHITSMYCGLGVLTSLLWMKVVRRNIVHAEITEDLGRNLEREIIKKPEENIENSNTEELTGKRQDDRTRENKLIGLGFFLSTQQILHHELLKEEKENYKESWVYNRYNSKIERGLITVGKAVKITTIIIPLLFACFWLLLLLYINHEWLNSVFNL